MKHQPGSPDLPQRLSQAGPALLETARYGPDDIWEVTPAMAKAGASELREKPFGEDLAKIAEDVFYAMLSAR